MISIWCRQTVQYAFGRRAQCRRDIAHADQSLTLRAVHRLDRDTTGCLLFAKNDAAFDAAVEIFKTRRVSKHYRVIVYGRYERAASTVEQDGR